MAPTDEPFHPSKRLICIFVIIGLLNLMTAIDATSISPTLPTIAKALNRTSTQAFWCGTSFLVTSAVFQPAFTLASDIFGRRFALVTAVVLFTLGAILCGVAHDFTLLIAARSVQGVGGGGIIALTEVLIADLIPLRERGKWFSVRSGTWALGSTAGPLIGGAFSQSSWRWIFWFNLPFCGIGLVAIPIFVKLEKGPKRMQFARIDYGGMVLFVGSLSAFLVPVSWGGVMYAWDSWRTLVPLLAGVAGFVAFAWYECFVPVEPLIPPKIFHNRTITVNYVCCILHGVIVWAIVYYMPLYYQGALGYSAVISGVGVLPLTLTLPPASLITGFAVAKSGRYRWSIWCGWAISTLGLGVLSLLDADTSVPKWIFLSIAPGLGLGMLFTGPMLAIQASANPDYLAMSASLSAFFRTLGQAIGVAIGGVIFQNQIKTEFESNPTISQQASQFAREATALVEYIHTLPRGSQRHMIEVAYANSLSVVWYVMCGSAGLALALSFFTQSFAMQQDLVSKQGLRTDSTASSQLREEVKSEV